MADRYTLESSLVDGYLLEDGSGVILLDQFPTGVGRMLAGSLDLSHPLLQGIAALFPLNEGAGRRTFELVRGVYGDGKSGVGSGLPGPQWRATPTGKSGLVFNGYSTRLVTDSETQAVGDFVDFHDYLDGRMSNPPLPLTIAFLVKPRTLNRRARVVHNSIWAFGVDGTLGATTASCIMTSYGVAENNSNTCFTNDRWTFASVTVKTSGTHYFAFYLDDGLEISNDAAAITPVTGLVNTTLLGGNANGEDFDGVLAYAAVWNRALSHRELRDFNTLMAVV